MQPQPTPQLQQQPTAQPPSQPAPAAVVRLVAPSTIQPDRIPFESLLRPDRLTADLLQLDLVRDAADPALTLPNVSDRDY